MDILRCTTKIQLLTHKVNKILYYLILFNFIIFFECLEIIETLKITHRNLLNNAANLKLVHEEVDVFII
jgi:hypothetical protein